MLGKQVLKWKKCRDVRAEGGDGEIWKEKGLTVNCEDMKDEKAVIS